jgi:excisionase family DNA binding protein
MDSNEIGLNEAAEKLGVHYMTAYRYVRTGLLPATKRGGTWRVAIDDLEKFVGRPSTQAGRGHRRLDRYVEPFISALTRGDERGAWTIIKSLRGAGCEVEELCLDLLVPALSKIGAGWASGTTSITDEHRASVVVPSLLGRLRALPLPPGQKRGLVVVGCPPAEEHAIPTSLFSLLLLGRRFGVDNLGNNTPAHVFTESVQTADKLIAVVFSVGSIEGAANLQECVDAVRSVRLDIPIFASGAAVTDATPTELGVDGVPKSFKEGLDLLTELVDP